MRWLLPILIACAAEPPADGPDPVERMGPISEPLPGQGAQHHATLACDEQGCIAARQVGAGVRFSLLDPDGVAISQTQPPTPPKGWNHPEIARHLGGWYLVAGTHGAPHALGLDRDGVPETEAVELHEPYPWGLWPDLALGEDGRAYAIWSTKTTPYWRVFDPLAPDDALGETWELALTQATVDPPAVAAVPGGYVRVWTVKNGFEWQVRLLWVDLDGNALGEPVIAARQEGISRGTRPQIAADASGNVAVAWRVWAAIGELPEGAWLRTYRPDGSPHGEAVRLDAELGDRPTVEAIPEGWLVAWEEGSPPAVWLQERAVDGSPIDQAVPVSDATVEAGRTNLAVFADGGRWSGFVSWEEVYAQGVDAILDADVRVRAVRGP